MDSEVSKNTTIISVTMNPEDVSDILFINILNDKLF